MKGTVSADKNELLFSEFGINYNNESELFKKGTVIVRSKNATIPCPPSDGDGSQSKVPSDADFYQKRMPKTATAHFQVRNFDIIGDGFWKAIGPVIGEEDGERQGLGSLSLKGT